MSVFSPFRKPAVVAAGLFLSSVACLSVQAQQASASGEIRRIDPAAGKVAIKQGPIAELDLPAMVLVYRVDPALLQGLAVGDQVRFTALRENGQYVIVAISK